MAKGMNKRKETKKPKKEARRNGKLLKERIPAMARLMSLRTVYLRSPAARPWRS